MAGQRPGTGEAPRVATATVEEFQAEFQGWDDRLTSLIHAAGTPGRWALLDRAPLRQWTKGTVTLLGDAAHPMFPFFAQGAAQAIEDAAVLARCLTADPADPAAALRRYEALRIPRTTRLQEVSHARSHVNHLKDGPEQRTRDASFREVDPLLASAWIYGYDADDEACGPLRGPPAAHGKVVAAVADVAQVHECAPVCVINVGRFGSWLVRARF
jgi:salicylate hydroxylase